MSHVVAEIIDGERLGKGTYSRPSLDKRDWKPIHHTAKLLRDVRRWNTELREGLFFGSDLNEDEITEKLWLVFLHLSDRANSKGGLQKSDTSKAVDADEIEEEQEEDVQIPGPTVSKFGGRAIVQSNEEEFAENVLPLLHLSKMSFAELQERITQHFKLSEQNPLFRLESEKGLLNGETHITSENWEEYIKVILATNDYDTLSFETLPASVGERVGEFEERARRGRYAFQVVFR